MILVALLFPLALLGALVGMHSVECWLEGTAVGEPEVSSGAVSSALAQGRLPHPRSGQASPATATYDFRVPVGGTVAGTTQSG